ncbi:hypothetical protein V3C10_16265 [[Clostridium] symbiosum]|uniref:lipopolysaccharide biosynthesis protein n=1 Tax=Clostridium symbiosum TaxID=1512 RepID=UPI001D06659D|nr:hypothetical protein [[Clostridium] symbiosum]MCB6608388.1 hypothetical protein [[Clostridium] symbiosum]MCB6930602.1 hypothetical protein [[Clostridium] symbiosum]
MKTRRTLYNSIASLTYYIITILLGIVNRKAVVSILGIEYQGINGLFSNVLSMLSIAELGIGTAIIYHLYKPIHDKNTAEIQVLMRFYKKCYTAIACIIGGLGICIIPGLKFIVADNTLPYSLTELYIWFLLDAVVSYLFTYKRSILVADQKNYIVVGCDLVYQCAVKLGQVVILYMTHDFILYLFVMVVTRIAENLYINYLSQKLYPFLIEKNAEKLSPQLLKDIKQKVKGTIFHKIGSFVVLGTDNILISKFLGLKAVGIYSNYFLIINAIKNICTQLISAATASVGQLLTEKNEAKAYNIFMEMQILNTGLINCAAIGIFWVTSPLITVIFGKEFTLSNGTLFILSFNFYIQGIRNVFSIFKEAAGILYEDRFIPVIESVTNIVMSILLLKYFGMAGIFMGTIISTLIIFFYTYPLLVYRNIFGKSLFEYYLEMLWLLIIPMISLFFSNEILKRFIYNNLYEQIIVNFIISVLISSLTFVCFYAIFHKESVLLIRRLTNLIRKNTSIK